MSAANDTFQRHTSNCELEHDDLHSTLHIAINNVHIRAYQNEPVYVVCAKSFNIHVLYLCLLSTGSNKIKEIVTVKEYFEFWVIRLEQQLIYISDRRATHSSKLLQTCFAEPRPAHSSSSPAACNNLFNPHTIYKPYNN